MEIREPNFISREYKVSMKYLFSRIGINLNVEKPVNVQTSSDDGIVLDTISIWTEERKDTNIFK